MGTIASQITSFTIVYSTVYSDVDQRKHQSSASLAFVREIHRGPVNSPHKWPVTRKMFPFDDVIMNAEFGNDQTIQGTRSLAAMMMSCFFHEKPSHTGEGVSILWNIWIFSEYFIQCGLHNRVLWTPVTTTHIHTHAPSNQELGPERNGWRFEDNIFKCI